VVAVTALHDPLTFDEGTHTYRLDGQVVPSVTQVIRPLFASSQPFWKDEHRERGQKVHEATFLYDHDRLAPEAITDDIVGYVDAYRRFREETEWKPVFSECRVYSRRYRFAGTFDRIFLTPGPPPGWVLVDIKTSKTVSKAAALQLAAYDIAALEEANAGVVIQEHYALHLAPDGKYRLVRFDDMAEARQAFLAALTLFNWRAKNGC
jgi:hypothetical protein